MRNDADNESWIEDELAGCTFADERLRKRYRTILEQLSGGIGESLPMACEDWAGTKAAYRFFSNERLDERDIFTGHFRATRLRFQATPDTVLVLHDTTEMSFKRADTQAVGVTRKTCKSRDEAGRPRLHTVCGMLLHSSLVVTTEGLPLGIAAAKFWTRKKFKGCDALKKRTNATRVPIEQKESVRWIDNLQESSSLLGDPQRCVHVGDRESDIYELFCAAQEAGTHFLVRTCVDRLAGDGKHTVADEMAEVEIQGVHEVEVRDKNGKPSVAKLQLRYRKIRLLPPKGKQLKYPPLTATVIHATELENPQDRDRIEWKLVTDLDVDGLEDALRMLRWYALRWKIEVFHKILKSGCHAESARLRTAERLVRLIAVFCILSWRVFWMTMLNRTGGCTPASAVFTAQERTVLDNMVPDLPRSNKHASGVPGTLSHYIIKLARLGGYLARSNDPYPGNIVVWRGMSRLTDICLGLELAGDVGN
jgi:hypothetical protein